MKMMETSKSEYPSAAPAAPKKTVIEAGTGFKGSFDSNCPIVVKGSIEGDVNAPSLSVEAGGVVQGKVKVEELDSKGELEGEYEAQLVRLSGKVRDNTVIVAQALEVSASEDACRFGECTLEVGELPSKEDILSAWRKSEAPEPANADEEVAKAEDSSAEISDTETAESGDAEVNAVAADSSDEPSAAEAATEPEKAEAGSSEQAAASDDEGEEKEAPKKRRRRTSRKSRSTSK